MWAWGMHFEAMDASDERAREYWSRVLKQGCTRAVAVRKLARKFLKTSSFDDLNLIRIIFMSKPLGC